jgi:S-formylglutathione hydrolase
MENVSEIRCFGGIQGVYRHDSAQTGTPMRFSVFVPGQARDQRMPAVYWLSGLTCTEENFTVKAGAQRSAAELGLVAGFYVDAIEAPWSRHYRMRSYVETELPALVAEHFPVDVERQSILGHSMAGHGALTIALRNPDRYRAVSAFAPICSPLGCPWRKYDACALIDDGARIAEILVDQGTEDGFLDQQLKPERLRQACAAAGIPLTLRMQPGYDHSYYFIATFIEDHLRWHAERLAP